jgi:hypothetical protein
VSEELRVEFRLAIARRPEPRPLPEPGVKTERLRVDRAARRARNLALAYWIDGLIRSGEVADLAAVARMCGVSRARVTAIMDLLECTPYEQALCITSANAIHSTHAMLSPAQGLR